MLPVVWWHTRLILQEDLKDVNEVSPTLGLGGKEVPLKPAHPRAHQAHARTHTTHTHHAHTHTTHAHHARTHHARIRTRTQAHARAHSHPLKCYRSHGSHDCRITSEKRLLASTPRIPLECTSRTPLAAAGGGANKRGRRCFGRMPAKPLRCNATRCTDANCCAPRCSRHARLPHAALSALQEKVSASDGSSGFGRWVSNAASSVRGWAALGTLSTLGTLGFRTRRRCARVPAHMWLSPKSTRRV
jgi:hypothetical protein